MTFQEAANDINRPLSITPREWMYSVEASLAEEKQLVDKTIVRIASNDETKKENVDGLEKIEMGVDQIVTGIKIINNGLIDANYADLRPLEREIVNKVKDLIDTAIAPYMVDIIKELDKLETEDEKK
jgi:hypothetical protein